MHLAETRPFNEIGRSLQIVDYVNVAPDITDINEKGSNTPS